MGWGGVVAQGLAGFVSGVGKGGLDHIVEEQKIAAQKLRDAELSKQRMKEFKAQTDITQPFQKGLAEAQITAGHEDTKSRNVSAENINERNVGVRMKEAENTAAHYVASDANEKARIALSEKQIKQSAAQWASEKKISSDEDGNLINIDRAGKASYVTAPDGSRIKGSKLNGTDQATVSFAVEQVKSLERVAADAITASKAPMLDDATAKKYQELADRSRVEAEQYRKVVEKILPDLRDVGKGATSEFSPRDLNAVAMALKAKDQAAIDFSERRWPGITVAARKLNPISGGTGSW